MSINCSNFCLYQADGICNLKGKSKKRSNIENRTDIDCPYFLDSIKK